MLLDQSKYEDHITHPFEHSNKIQDRNQLSRPHAATESIVSIRRFLLFFGIFSYISFLTVTLSPSTTAVKPK